jgi:hypothetical protein
MAISRQDAVREETGHAAGSFGPLPRRPGPLGLCAPCLDSAITGAAPGRPFDPGAVPDAVVLTTVVQTFPIAGGQQIAAPVQMGVCAPCRERQLGTVSKKGLVTA